MEGLHMYQLQIERIIEAYPPQAKQRQNGPDYSIYSFKISGWINGEYVGEAMLDTLSGKEAGFVQAGWAGNVEIDTKFGTKYKIPTPPQNAPCQGETQGLQRVNTTQPPQHTPPPPPHAPPAQGAHKTPPPKQQRITFADVVAKHKRCFDAAMYIARWEWPVDEELPAEAIAALNSIAATLHIECSKNGIDIPVKKEEKKDERTLALEGIDKAMTEYELDASNVKVETLLAWWSEANCNSAMFASRVKQELEPEAAGDDDDCGLPF